VPENARRPFGSVNHVGSSPISPSTRAARIVPRPGTERKIAAWGWVSNSCPSAVWSWSTTVVGPRRSRSARRRCCRRRPRCGLIAATRGCAGRPGSGRPARGGCRGRRLGGDRIRLVTRCGCHTMGRTVVHYGAEYHSSRKTGAHHHRTAQTPAAPVWVVAAVWVVAVAGVGW
jgi:hypothetical protein